MVQELYGGVQTIVEMTTVDGHTFDETRLSGGWVIDAGCRGWEFAYQCFHRNCKVYAIDIENLYHTKASHFDVKFKQAALTNYSGQVDAYFFGDGTANFIQGINGVPADTEDRPCRTETVPTITLQDIYNEIGTDIDLLKLDIEGSEYFVLNELEPIPKQISVETHQHCHETLHNEYWPAIMERLCKHYKMILNVEEPRYLYMDVLFIRRDLL